MKTRQPWRLTLVVGLMSLALGLCLGFLISPLKTPGVSGEGTNSKELDTPIFAFRSPQRLPATATLSAGGDLTTNVGGTITKYDCAVGSIIASGTSFLSLDEAPLLVLHTEVPLWRDLGPGAQGADVRALQTELNRLGHGGTVTGTWNAGTTAAVKKLWLVLGIKQLDTLPRIQVIWLPGLEAGVRACPAKLGSTLGPGGSVATITDILSALKVEIPRGAPRVVVAGEAREDIPEDGNLTDSAFLAAYSATASYRAWSSNPEGQSLTVESELKEPIEAITVPPSALYNIVGDSACLESGGKGFAVRILSSELGQTTVSATDAESGIKAGEDASKSGKSLPKSVNPNPGKDAPSCASKPAS